MMTRMRRRTVWVVVSVLVVGFVLAYAFAVGPALHKRRVNALIERYSTNPDEETANTLAELLDEEKVPAEQGNRILKMLLTPRVAVRETYRSDRPIFVGINHAFWLHFPRMTMHRRVWYFPLDEGGGPSSATSGGYGGGGRGVAPLPLYRRVSVASLADGSRVAIAQAGTSTASIRYEYDLHPPSNREGDAPLYTCRIDIPLTIRVVAPDEAEQVKLVSNDQLDKEMKTSFTLKTRHDVIDTYGGPTGSPRCEIRQGFRISWSALPENVAFKVAYRDERGFTKPFKDFTLIQRAGFAWSVAPVPMDNLGLGEGDYKGALVLEADESVAYRDPALKTIWDGVLEFPVEFSVTKAVEPESDE